MPRNLLQLMQDEPQDWMRVDTSVLGEEPEPLAPPAPMPASVPVTGGQAPLLPEPTPALRQAFSDVEGPDEELRAAQAEDADNRQSGRVSDALYAAFTRSPVQFRDRGGSATGELLHERGQKRQGEQDKLNAEMTRARIAASGARGPGHSAEQNELMKVHAEMGRRKLANEEADRADKAAEKDREKRELEADRRELGKVLKMDLTDMSREGITLLAKRTGADQVLEDRRSARTARGAGGGKRDDGMKMTAGETAKIGDLDTASQVMDDLWNTFGAKAGDAKAALAQFVPATKAKEYNDERRVTAQVVGGILEGGKLTEEDFARYYSMLPDPSDSASRAKAKWDAVKRLLHTRRSTLVKTLKDVGFKVGGLDPASAPQGARVRVSNGKETLEIDEADVAAAEADGFKRVR